MYCKITTIFLIIKQFDEEKLRKRYITGAALSTDH